MATRLEVAELELNWNIDFDEIDTQPTVADAANLATSDPAFLSLGSSVCFNSEKTYTFLAKALSSSVSLKPAYEFLCQHSETIEEDEQCQQLLCREIFTRLLDLCALTSTSSTELPASHLIQAFQTAILLVDEIYLALSSNKEALLKISRWLGTPVGQLRVLRTLRNREVLALSQKQLNLSSIHICFDTQEQAILHATESYSKSLEALTAVFPGCDQRELVALRSLTDATLSETILQYSKACAFKATPLATVVKEAKKKVAPDVAGPSHAKSMEQTDEAQRGVGSNPGQNKKRKKKAGGWRTLVKEDLKHYCWDKYEKKFTIEKKPDIVAWMEGQLAETWPDGAYVEERKAAQKTPRLEQLEVSDQAAKPASRAKRPSKRRKENADDDDYDDLMEEAAVSPVAAARAKASSKRRKKRNDDEYNDSDTD